MRCKQVVINCALYKWLRYAYIIEDESLKAEIILCLAGAYSNMSYIKFYNQ